MYNNGLALKIWDIIDNIAWYTDLVLIKNRIIESLNLEQI